MAAKLGSSIKRIPWSLLLKTAAFFLFWIAPIPIWLFALAAMGLYFASIFNAMRFSVVFGAILVLLAASPSHGFLSGAIGSVAFFLLLGIKDLFFVERRAAYEVLTILLLFLLSLLIASRNGEEALPPALAFGAFFFLLASQLLREKSSQAPVTERHAPPALPALLCAGVISLLLLEFGLALFRMPFAAFQRAALLFLGSAVCLIVLNNYRSGALDAQRILTLFSVFFVSAVFVLISTSWGL